MADTRGQSGQEHFQAHRDALALSSSARFSTLEDVPGSGGDGHITLETRGAPALDEPAPKPKAKKQPKAKK